MRLNGLSSVQPVDVTDAHLCLAKKKSAGSIRTHLLEPLFMVRYLVLNV